MNYVFETYFGVSFSLVQKGDENESSNIFICYKESKANNQLYFAAHPLLFETDVHHQDIVCTTYNDHVIFFQVNDPDSALPYDPFALIFYMLTRYEEYLPFEADEHGRFPAKASLAYQNGFLDQPIVEQVINDVLHCILGKFPSFQFKPPGFQFEVSYDVDAPFAYRGKGFVKNLVGSFLMLINGRINQGIDRLGFTFLGGKDPFDHFFDILSSLEEYQLKAFFFLLMEHKGKHNPAINYQHYAFDILVNKLSKSHVLGIHPSYVCTSEEKLRTEQKRFEEVTQLRANISRNHFLRIKLPETYQLLESAGITHDFSMAFPDHTGFRAGCSRPFPFYDLTKETSTSVVIHPFCAMDATFEYYIKKGTEKEIMEQLKRLYNNVIGVNGVFHIVFHNDLISGYLSKRNWKKIMIEIMDYHHTKSSR
ncbi:MAG: hypothetical protein R2730_00550 [Chitinophagales bacterium]